MGFLWSLTEWSEPARTGPMRIGAVAKACGVTPWWIRRAERTGQIPRAHRTGVGQREWTAADVVTIQAAVAAQQHEQEARWQTQRERMATVRAERRMQVTLFPIPRGAPPGGSAPG